MLLKTSKGIEYVAEWIDKASTGDVYMQINDSRPLHIVAEELDGLEWVERYDENQGDKRFEGFNTVTMVTRDSVDSVMVRISKKE